MRGGEKGWKQIGMMDAVSRRSLWMRALVGLRERVGVIELCAGREGDDAYVRLTADNPQWPDLQNVLMAAYDVAETEAT